MNLKDILVLSQEDLKKKLFSEIRKLNYKPIWKDGFIYAEGEIPVLLVAHMDTVHKELPEIICESECGRYLMSPMGIGGDDRCGIFMILELAKKYKCHILFTEDEETGGKGAKKFCKSKIKPDVNFALEFDRKGIDEVVYYSCDNEDFSKFIEGYGFEKNTGSYSDIKDVAPYIGVAACNLSCGFINAHTLHEVIWLDAVDSTLTKVGKMLEDKDYNTKYIYKEKVYEYKSFYNRNNAKSKFIYLLENSKKLIPSLRIMTVLGNGRVIEVPYEYHSKIGLDYENNVYHVNLETIECMPVPGMYVSNNEIAREFRTHRESKGKLLDVK